MAFTITCEASDLHSFLDEHRSMAERLASAESRARAVFDMGDEILRLKNELATRDRPIGPVTHETLSALIKGVSSGNRIAAIKEVRIILGLGLREAKELVDEATNYNQTVR